MARTFACFLYVFGLTITLLLYLFSILVLSLSCAPASTDNLPTPSTRYVLTSRDLQSLGGRLGIKLASGFNNSYLINGSEVKLNRLVPRDKKDLPALFDSLFCLTGSINTVLLGDDAVFEVISSNPLAAENLRQNLVLPALQKAKLTPHSLYGEGTLASEKVSSVKLVLEQVIEVNERLITVKFTMPEPSRSAESILAEVLKNNPFNEAFISKGVVVEVDGTQDDQFMVMRCLRISPPSPDSPARFYVRFKAIPVSHMDYMKQNELSYYGMRGASADELLKVDPTLIFGSKLPLSLDLSLPHSLVPTPSIIPIDDLIVSAEISHDGLIPPGEAVQVDLFVNTGIVRSAEPEDLSPYLAESSFFPLDDEIIKLSEEIHKEAAEDSVRSKVIRIHSWVRENIRYGGEIIGSRYGVKQVLKQGFGRCWDLSDAFITLARASGIPCRQIGGWIYGKEGHIWSQVWLEDEKIWLDVDAASEQLGVSSYYIPIWGTRNGDMPFIYASFPRIERMELKY